MQNEDPCIATEMIYSPNITNSYICNIPIYLFTFYCIVGLMWFIDYTILLLIEKCIHSDATNDISFDVDV